MSYGSAPYASAPYAGQIRAGATAYTLDAQPAPYSTFGAATLSFGRTPLNAQPANYIASYSAAALVMSGQIASPGVFSVTGHAATLVRPTTYFVAGMAAYSMVATEASLVRSTQQTSPGVFSCTGYAATLIHFARTADPAIYTTSGAAGLIFSRWATSHGTFALTGSTADLRAIRLLAAAPRTFVAAGTARLRRGATLMAGSASLAANGGAAHLTSCRVLRGHLGAFAGIAAPAVFRRTYAMPAQPGLYAMIGKGSTSTTPLSWLPTYVMRIRPPQVYVRTA